MSAHKQKYEEQIQTINQAHREYLMVRNDYRIALKELESLRAEKAELIEALRSVKDRLQIVMSEPNGLVRETMINNLLIDLP